MLDKIVEFSVRQRLFIIAATILVFILGILSFQRLPIDAFPDPSPCLVQIYTEAQGMAPEEVERLISYPIEASMFGLPRVKNIRSFSTFALSMVSVYFKGGTDIYFARQLVSQRLPQVREQLPAQAENPVLGPISTGLGLVYLYYLDGEDYSPLELRTIQDWIIKFDLQSVPEVTQVLSIGGDIRQFQILVDPQKLIKFHLTLDDLIDAVKKNNQNIGASFITKGKEEYIVRSIGLAKTVDHLKNIHVANYLGTPIFVKDLAEVSIGHAIKRGTALAEGKGEVVAGMILKLFGSNTVHVIENIEKKIENINKSLPPGVRIVPFYNQASLVKKCVFTVSSSLMLGIGLVMFILFLFMGDFRSSLVATLSLPFSILFAFILMRRINLSADLMSFGGLAIGIGIFVDASIVMIENIFRHVQSSSDAISHCILRAANEVTRPIFYAILIIILVFLPIYTLQGVEGIMFRPLAYTITFALLGSLIFSFTSVPAISHFLISRRKKLKGESFIIANVKRVYIPLFRKALERRTVVLLVTALLFISSLVLIPFLGTEFIPRLEEGTTHLRVTMDPNISLQEAIHLTQNIEKEIKSFSEVQGVLSRIGRGELGSHAHFVNNAEILITLRPFGKWKNFRNKNDLIAAIEKKLENFPGILLNFTQPIAHNLDELISGVKAQIAIKVYGEDYSLLRKKSAEIRGIISGVRGASDVQVEQFTGQNQLQIILDRDRIVRYGVHIADVQETIEAALGGITLGKIYEGNRKFDIFLRFRPEFRKDIPEIENLLIALPTGGSIPLKNLAEIKEVTGPRHINRENNRRYITIQCNVRGRDIGSFVGEAQKKIEDAVVLPSGYTLTWGGQFELQQQANRRLMLIIPVTLVAIGLLLFTVFYSIKDVLIIFLNIPLALMGGIFALTISGQYLSVPASIGFIALFGIALENGLVLVTYLHKLLAQGMEIDEVLIKGVSLRIRPVLMTAFTTMFGLIPLLVVRGAGAEIQRPLATVVIGGLFTSTLVTLFVLPIIYKALKRQAIQP
ncbi:MAG: efflux RND transporter permease subunit [Candidatus Aminicenantales bacterium]